MDDEPMVLRALHRGLSRRFDVYAVSSCLQGIEAIRRNPIRVVVADHRGYSNGIVLLEWASQNAPMLLRILVSNDPNPPRDVPHSILHKPIVPNDIETAIDELLQKGFDVAGSR